ncbi:squalene/phytoene synthase family protein, partial [Pseudomonadota bacterium]
RCYLSTEWMREHDLSLEMLLDKNNANKVQPLYHQAIHVALDHFCAAEAYILEIPEQCARLRLAALWPLLIGLETLHKLAVSNCYLDKDTVIKVKRGWVYRMIFRSLFASGSNSKLQKWVGNEVLLVNQALAGSLRNGP